MARTAIARRTPARSSPRRAYPVVRRAASRAATAVRDEKHTLAAIATAAALGYAARQGTQIPHLAQLGVEGTVGVALWFGSRMTRSRTLEHMATGALAVAAYDWARGSSAVSGVGASDPYAVEEG